MGKYLFATILSLFMPTILSGCGGNDTSTTGPKYFAYVANRSSNDVSAYSINDDGALTTVAGSPAGSNPLSVTMDPTGKFVYVANNNSNDVSVCSINADGALTAIAGATIAAGTNPNSIVTVRR